VFRLPVGCGFGSGQSWAMRTDEIVATADFVGATAGGTGSGVTSTTGSVVGVGGAVDLPSSLAAQEPKTKQSAIAEN